MAAFRAVCPGVSLSSLRGKLRSARVAQHVCAGSASVATSRVLPTVVQDELSARMLVLVADVTVPPVVRSPSWARTTQIPFPVHGAYVRANITTRDGDRKMALLIRLPK